MENKLPDQNPLDSGETPFDVFVKIIVTTLATLLVGWLVVYFGLV